MSCDYPLYFAVLCKAVPSSLKARGRVTSARKGTQTTQNNLIKRTLNYLSMALDKECDPIHLHARFLDIESCLLLNLRNSTDNIFPFVFESQLYQTAIEKLF